MINRNGLETRLLPVGTAHKAVSQTRQIIRTDNGVCVKTGNNHIVKRDAFVLKVAGGLSGGVRDIRTFNAGLSGNSVRVKREQKIQKGARVFLPDFFRSPFHLISGPVLNSEDNQDLR